MDWKEFTNKTIALMGFTEWSVEIDNENRRGTIFIHDHIDLVKDNLPRLVKHINHLFQLVAKKTAEPPIFFDVNNYRREREVLILELARAAARKAIVKKESISLPAMNAYERRIVHVELATHPDVITESVDMGRDRHIIIKTIHTNEDENVAEKNIKNSLDREE